MKRYILNKPLVDAWKVASGKTDVDLAVFLGAHPMSVNRWLNGRQPVPLAVAIDLERITGHDFRDLVIEQPEAEAEAPAPAEGAA